MSLSIEELMKPRAKVIAPYPNMTFEVGDIIDLDLGKTLWSKTWWTTENVVQYPHLFKKLEWWEDRKPEDMPEYVKKGDRIYFIKREADILHSHGFVLRDSVQPTNYTDCLPSTHEEYLEYQKLKS